MLSPSRHIIHGPSLSDFQGLPWESWINALGRTSPIADKPPEPTPVDKFKGNVMKLPKEDIMTFGLCPEEDPFSVVMCDTCGMVIKPQAFLHHFERRHSNRPNDSQPSQPSIEVAASEKLENNKGREGVVNPPPSLPVSLTLESPIPEPGSSEMMEELSITVDGLEKERDFYLGKLRAIEVLCQEQEGDLPVLNKILAILNATEDGFAPPDEIENLGVQNDEEEEYLHHSYLHEYLHGIKRYFCIFNWKTCNKDELMLCIERIYIQSGTAYSCVSFCLFITDLFLKF